MPKTAITHAAAIYIECPHCEEEQETANGSVLWTYEDLFLLGQTTSSGKNLKCQDCGRRMIVPPSEFLDFV